MLCLLPKKGMLSPSVNPQTRKEGDMKSRRDADPGSNNYKESTGKSLGSVRTA